MRRRTDGHMVLSAHRIQLSQVILVVNVTGTRTGQLLCTAERFVIRPFTGMRIMRFFCVCVISPERYYTQLRHCFPPTHTHTHTQTHINTHYNNCAERMRAPKTLKRARPLLHEILSSRSDDGIVLRDYATCFL